MTVCKIQGLHSNDSEDYFVFTCLTPCGEFFSKLGGVTTRKTNRQDSVFDTPDGK